MLSEATREATRREEQLRSAVAGAVQRSRECRSEVRLCPPHCPASGVVQGRRMRDDTRGGATTGRHLLTRYPRRFWQRSRGTLISDHQTRPHQTSDAHQTIRTTPQKVYVLLHCSILLVYLE